MTQNSSFFRLSPFPRLFNIFANTASCSKVSTSSFSIPYVTNHWSNSSLIHWLLFVGVYFFASFSSSSQHKVFSISRIYFKSLAKSFLPLEFDDNSYALYVDEFSQSLKNQYLDLLTKFLSSFPRSHLPSALITGNFGYFAERELSTACKSLSIPFIVIHKECFKPPGRIKFFKQVYERRGPTNASHLLVYNSFERNLQIDSGVVDSSRISVTGMPRLDNLHHARRVEARRSTFRTPHLVAFGFTPNTGLPRIPRKNPSGIASYEFLSDSDRDPSWHELFYGYLSTLHALAISHPELRITLKLKRRLRDCEPTINFFSDIGCPNNLTITSSLNSQELIKSSTAVTGFNSTTLLEGLAFGVRCCPIFC